MKYTFFGVLLALLIAVVVLRASFWLIGRLWPLLALALVAGMVVLLIKGLSASKPGQA